MGYATYEALLAAANEAGSLGEAVVTRECEETGRDREAVLARLDAALDVMEAAVGTGLEGRGPLALRTRRAATPVASRSRARTSSAPASRTRWRPPLAVAEVNASMGRVVAAPTGGPPACSPACCSRWHGTSALPRERIVLALAAAGGIGSIIAAKASLSGAASGCQAEIGAGAAMAAAAAAELAGGTPVQSGHAASLALQGLLGLVCDPVGGLVEVPCVVRNATGAAVALAAAEMALAGVTFPIPFDEVAAAMGSVGRSLPPSLRETALGGLAATPTGRRLVPSTGDPR